MVEGRKDSRLAEKKRRFGQFDQRRNLTPKSSFIRALSLAWLEGSRFTVQGSRLRALSFEVSYQPGFWTGLS
jgi:hypothetical protein